MFTAVARVYGSTSIAAILGFICTVSMRTFGSVNNVRMPPMRFKPREDMPSLPHLSMNDSHIFVTAYGCDNLGQVSSLANRVTEVGGNLSAVKMVTIGEDICMMLVVSIPSEASEALSTGLTKLSEELGIRIATTEIVPSERQPVSQNLKHRARIQIVGQDQPGVLKGLTNILAGYGMKVRSLESRIYHSDLEEGDGEADELLFHLEAMVLADEMPGEKFYEDLALYGKKLSTEVKVNWVKERLKSLSIPTSQTGSFPLVGTSPSPA